MAGEEKQGAAEKKQIKEDRNKLKQEEKQQRKAIKERAKEIAKREAALEEAEDTGGGISSFLVTTIIVVIWIAILCLLIKLDVGGFGSSVLTPLLKDVPVVNKILPGAPKETETNDTGAYGGYTSLKEAVDYIKVLELELEHSQTVNNTDSEEITSLKAEVERLKEFEAMQVEFQRIKEQFYEEVIYSDKGPGADEYRVFYEGIDPTTAAALYKQVVQKKQVDKEIQDFANTYAAMKPKQAAAIFEDMDKAGDINRVAKILEAMDSDTRGKILGAMDSAVAAKLTKIMDPQG